MCEVQDCREAEVAVPVVMSFCVAGVALYDIPCVCVCVGSPGTKGNN